MRGTGERKERLERGKEEIETGKRDWNEYREIGEGKEVLERERRDQRGQRRIGKRIEGLETTR